MHFVYVRCVWQSSHLNMVTIWFVLYASFVYQETGFGHIATLCIKSQLQLRQNQPANETTYLC